MVMAWLQMVTMVHAVHAVRPPPALLPVVGSSCLARSTLIPSQVAGQV